MTIFHEGGCLCGKVRFRVAGEPARVGICHCRTCQLRTGSAFSVSVYFAVEKVTRLAGELQTYGRRSQSGFDWLIERCSNCGTSVFWTIGGDAWSGLQGTAGGCYDPPAFWYDVTRELFTRSKADFCTIDAPEHHETHPAYAPRTADPSRLDGTD
jgi:hypothetical protein